MNLFQKIQLKKDIRDQKNEEAYQILTSYENCHLIVLKYLTNIEIHINHYFSRVQLETFSITLVQLCEKLKEYSNVLLEKYTYIKANKKELKTFKNDKRINVNIILEDSKHIVMCVQDLCKLLNSIPHYNSNITKAKAIVNEVYDNFLTAHGLKNDKLEKQI